MFLRLVSGSVLKNISVAFLNFFQALLTEREAGHWLFYSSLTTKSSFITLKYISNLSVPLSTVK